MNLIKKQRLKIFESIKKIDKETVQSIEEIQRKVNIRNIFRFINVN